MSPSALTPVTSTTELTTSAINHTIATTAHSIAPTSTSTNTAPSTLPELNASLLTTTLTSTPRPVPAPNSAEVWSQNICTDHMITASWTSTNGWSAPSLQPYGPLSLMPTAHVLHYATECFEGMKFYRGHDGKLRLFRPDRNCKRMLRSATRIALPAFDPEELRKLIVALVSVDGAKWLPKERAGSFLYLRPTMIATAPGLGVQKPKEALLYIFACCFPSFDEPGAGPPPTLPAPNPDHLTANGHASTVSSSNKPGLRLLASAADTIRAWPGGFGSAKVGANYGPSLLAQGEARARGYNQILWLFGPDNDVTEAGASNFFVIWRTRKGKLEMVTAPLDDGIILEGVTRGSVLEIARSRLAVGVKWEGLEGLEVVERKYGMGELEEAVREGRMVEAFAVGTAYFVSPVSEIHFRGKDLDIPLANGESGVYATVLKTWLRNIMYGKERHEWSVVVEEREE